MKPSQPNRNLWGRLVTCGPIGNRPNRAPARSSSPFAHRTKLFHHAALKIKAESRLVLIDAVATGNTANGTVDIP